MGAKVVESVELSEEFCMKHVRVRLLVTKERNGKKEVKCQPWNRINFIINKVKV